MGNEGDACDLVLFQRQGVLQRAQSKSLICMTVAVPPGFSALAISFDYHPRQCTDRERNSRLVEAAVETQLLEAEAAGVLLRPSSRRGLLERPALRSLRQGMRNLLNLTLTDAAGSFRGRWDRNLSTDTAGDEIICLEWATRGFVQGPLPAGNWTVTLEVHTVISRSCSYDLRVTGSPVARVQPRSAPLPASSPVRREYSTALPEGWLRGELHCHSRASDGQYQPAELLRRAEALGLDFVALTDHNIAGGLRALEGSGAPVVIPGTEITTFAGHFLCLGLERSIPWYTGVSPLKVEQLCRLVHQQGGLFGLAHPFVLGDPVCVGCRLTAPSHWQFPKLELDLLEVWSRGFAEELADRHALALWDKLRAGGRNVVAVAGRDWHGSAQEQATAGRPFPATVVRARPEVRSLLEALRRGACYSSVGPVVELTVLHAGGAAGLGEAVSLTCQEVVVRAAVDGLEERAWLDLLCGGAPQFQQRVGPGRFVVERPVSCRPGGVRLELWSEDRSRPLVITNAVGSPL